MCRSQHAHRTASALVGQPRRDAPLGALVAPQTRKETVPIRVRGFTLIELLVVIAIIAILAAMLFPVFGKAREKARQTSCISNVKQMTLGVQMYVQDYDETFPGGGGLIAEDDEADWAAAAGTSVGKKVPWSGWRSIIHPYVKNWQIGYCPSRKSLKMYSAATGGHGSTTSYFYGSTYAMNATLNGRWGMNEYDTTLASIPEPAITIQIYEHYRPPGFYCYIRNSTTFRWLGGSTAAEMAAWLDDETYAKYVAPHNGGQCVSYVDGHAKWVNREALLETAWTDAPANGGVAPSWGVPDPVN